MPWKIEYDNDVGSNDESFFEYWNVTHDGDILFRSNDKNSAEWLCSILNNIPSDKMINLIPKS